MDKDMGCHTRRHKRKAAPVCLTRARTVPESLDDLANEIRLGKWVEQAANVN
jgi:hypothetical protein